MVSGLIASGGGDLDRISRREQLLVAALHALGGGLGGAAVAFGMWCLFSLLRLVPEPVRLGVVAAILVLAFMADTRLIRLPNTDRQVPQVWYRRFGLRRAYFLYGIVLGGAFATKVNNAVTIAVFVLGALLLPLGAAIAVGSAYGLGRGASICPGLFAPGSFQRFFYTGGRRVRQVWTGAAAVVSLALLATTLTL